MKIAMITGSPHRRGTSALLAEQFIRGAESAGHTVSRFDTAFHNVHPCIACEKCHMSKSAECVFKDDMQDFFPQLLGANAVVLVTPIYYYGTTAQCKAVIDRCYAKETELLRESKKTMLIMAFSDASVATCDGLVQSYQNVVRHLGWEDRGILAAHGCANAEDLRKTSFLEIAHEMGREI